MTIASTHDVVSGMLESYKQDSANMPPAQREDAKHKISLGMRQLVLEAQAAQFNLFFINGSVDLPKYSLPTTGPKKDVPNLLTGKEVKPGAVALLKEAKFVYYPEGSTENELFVGYAGIKAGTNGTLQCMHAMSDVLESVINGGYIKPPN